MPSHSMPLTLTVTMPVCALNPESSILHHTPHVLIGAMVMYMWRTDSVSVSVSIDAWRARGRNE